MLDLLVFAAIAAAVVVAILALLKVLIEFPGMGEWCLRSIHKKTETSRKNCESSEDISFGEIIIHDGLLDHSKKCERNDPRASKSVSRTSTETEMFKRRFEEIDEILSAGNSDQILSSARLQEIRGKHFDRRHSSHDHRHRAHHHKHHHKKRRHSHSHDPHRHHHRRHQPHHHHQDHHHHQNNSSNTDIEYDNSPSKSRSLHVHSSGSEISGSPEHSSPRRARTVHPTSPLGTQERINQLATKNNMRININNVNILINRHTQKDVTINIDMEDNGELEGEEVEEHHDEVRSSDSGIGWDMSEHDHHEHDRHDTQHHHDGHDTHHHHDRHDTQHHHDRHDVHHLPQPPTHMEPVSEELERNVIVESTQSKELERNVIVESTQSKEGPEEGLFKLESLPKRLRHNTYS